MPRTTNLADQVKKVSKKKIKKAEPVDSRILIPSGSTMLDLCCSDTPFGAYVPGTLVNPVGDKSAGKTMGYHSMLAEMCRWKRFKDYHLIHRDIEHAVQWDIAQLFGDKLAKRIDMKSKVRTIEDMKKDLRALIKEGRPFVYGLDAYDAVGSKEGDAKKDDDESGYANAKKTKELGFILQESLDGIVNTGSLLVIISQVRQNMDPAPFTPKFKRNGGQALGHYVSHEPWIFKGKKLYREVNKRKRQIGVMAMPRVEKNRLTGKVRSCEFPIYYDYGIDDLGSCVSFMIKEGFWKKKDGKIRAKELRVSGANVGALVAKIEEKNLEKELKTAVGRAWLEIEESMKLNRKKKFQ